MSNKQNRYLKVKNSDKKEVKSNDSNEVCVLNYTHKHSCACEVWESNCGNILVNRKASCDPCDREVYLEYGQHLNAGRLAISFDHYKDIILQAGVTTIYLNAESCKHVKDPKKLKEQFKKIADDFNIALSEKPHILEFNTELSMLSYLLDQGYGIEDHRDEDTTTKFIITFPENRISTTEDEARAINGLSDRPVITNVEKRFFLVLKEEKLTK